MDGAGIAAAEQPPTVLDRARPHDLRRAGPARRDQDLPCPWPGRPVRPHRFLRGVRGERDVQVDMVVALTGAVVYADIDLGAAVAAPSDDAGDHLGHVLDASYLKLWPQDRTTIQDLVEDAQPHPFMPFGREAPPADPAEQYSTHDQRTDSASWSLGSRYTGEPLALRVRTGALQDRSWPSVAAITRRLSMRRPPSSSPTASSARRRALAPQTPRRSTSTSTTVRSPPSAARCAAA